MAADASTPAHEQAPLTISVAIATYNAGPFLAAAVRSALDQRPAPYEVVVCDDGSTDGSLDGLADLGSAVRLVRHETNRGEAAAKNSAVLATSTDLVALLDADDEFLPGRLAAVVAMFSAQPELDVVTTDAFLVHDGAVLGTWYKPEHPVPDGDQRVAVLSRNPVFGHAVVRRQAFLAVGGFDVGIRYAADWDLWIRMVLAGSRIGVVPEPLSLYRLHDDNSSSNRLAMATCRLDILRRTLERDDLSETERQLAAQTQAVQRRLERRELMKSTLDDAARPARRAAWAVARDPGQPARSRALAAMVAALPTPARAIWRRRALHGWTGPGGMRVRRGRSGTG